MLIKTTIKAVANGLETESDTDNFPRMDMINKAHVDYISTDLLLPDYKGLGKIAYDLRSLSKWNKLDEHGQVGFGALFLEMTYAGEAEITLGKQTFTINDSNGIDAGNGFRTISFQILLYHEDPVAEIKAMSSGFNVKDSRLRLVTFPQLL